MKRIATDAAPPALGSYSQAIVHGDTVYCSGQIGLTPAGTWAGSDVATQTTAVLNNLSAVLKAANSGPSRVMRATIFLVSMEDFAVVNEIYADFFGNHRPARACIEARRLPMDAKVEISCIAALNNPE